MSMLNEFTEPSEAPVFYPGLAEEEVQLAVQRADKLYEEFLLLNPYYANLPLRLPEICELLNFKFDSNIQYAENILMEALNECDPYTREQGYILQNLGIVHRIKRNDEACLDYLIAAEIIGRDYRDLNLVAECLANRVDLFILWANNPPSQERYDIHDLELFSKFYTERALVVAVEAFHLARKLDRKDLYWFLWKITEASFETGNEKYIKEYLLTIIRDKSVRGALMGTFKYSLKRIGEKSGIIKR